MVANLEFTLSYTGRRSDQHEIDFYDAAEALVGFQRYLALTTHLLVNNEIITQAPSLKNARIYAVPPEDGSWRITAHIAMIGTSLAAVGGGLFAVGTADKDTPMGNLGRSVYEYVVHELVGVHPNYEKTIGEVYRDKKRADPNFPDLSQSKLDSLTEKCQSAVRRMHRPIIASRTATQAEIYYDDGSGDIKTTGTLNKETYDYLAYTEKDINNTLAVGRVTSYNVNTFKGRIYLPDEKRPVPFVIADYARTSININAIAQSLSATARDFKTDGNDIKCFVVRNRSRTNRLKGLIIHSVLSP